MKAGRELDALVAEKVMGAQVEWGQTFTPDDWETSDYPTETHGPGIRNWDPGNRPGNTMFFPPLQTVPFYSTDIAAAMQVVEKMQGEPDGPQAWWWLIQDTIVRRRAGGGPEEPTAGDRGGRGGGARG